MAKKRPALGRGLAELLGDGPASAPQTTPGEADEERAPSGRRQSPSPPSRSRRRSATTDGPAPDAMPAPGTPAVVTTASPATSAAGTIVDLPVTAIRPNPRQPRRSFDPEALSELARSLESAGLVQPVIVRLVGEGYELIAGERRWRAAQQAGFSLIPAIVRQASDTESLELALIENVVRQQLNAIDEAFALQVLRDDLGVTQESLAARVGKSRSAIANKIRLLDLPPPVQDLLVNGELSEGHGRALLGLPSRGEQLRLARRAASRGLSVRAVEAEVRTLAEAAGQPKVPKGKSAVAALPPELLDEVRDRFYGLLEVLPKVKSTGKGGHIELAFDDLAHLRRILDRL